MKCMIELSKVSSHLAKSIPRLLTQLCRDEDSPLYGCFDRHYWHYKMRDFPSMVLQQPVCVLDLISRQELILPNVDISPEKASEWMHTALRFWAKSQRKNGSFDEYYPFESGFPPTAFSLYSTALVARHNEVDDEVKQAMEKAAAFLLQTPEKQAYNQEIVALTGCSLTQSLGIPVDNLKLESRWDEVFENQSQEGWFNEYDGADTGYLSVTCDALYDYYQIGYDQRAKKAASMAANYIYHFLTIADNIPAMINSRNTDYILPYGLSRFGSEDRFASSIVKSQILGIEKPQHYLHHIDDRYLTHYVYVSWFRALSHFEKLSDDDPVPTTGAKWFPEARVFILHKPDEWSLHVAAGKGGVALKTFKDGAMVGNLGWRGILKKNQITCSHWQEPHTDVSFEFVDGEYRIKAIMPLMKHRHFVPSVLKHMILRILSRTIGKKLIPILKKMLIFRKVEISGNFERMITIRDSKVKILDRFNGMPSIKWKKSGWSSMRHVSSAGSFSFAEATNLSSTKDFSIETENIDE